MLDILLAVLFVVIFVKAAGLALRIAWGAAKAAACVLFAAALPALILCLLFTGGLFLLVPILLVVIALGVLKAGA